MAYGERGHGSLGNWRVELNGHYVAVHPSMCDYHRVRVRHKIATDEFLVNLIDVGASINVHRSDLRIMDPQFASLPAQAIRARLAGHFSPGPGF